MANISGQGIHGSGVVQQYVKGEMASMGYGFSSAHEPETPLTKTELPFTERVEPAESIAQGETTPVPTVEQRRFSAPMADWDPIR